MAFCGTSDRIGILGELVAKFNWEGIFERIEAKWKHVAYDPKSDKIYLLTDPYKCLDTNDVWFDFEDGRKEKKVLINNRRIRRSKTKNWIYLGLK